MDRGEVADYAELVSLPPVSRPRITQITNLTLLAPEIQEVILFLSGADGGCGGLGERALRCIYKPRSRCLGEATQRVGQPCG